MLIKCPECELQVSDKAANCPHCGYPMKSGSENIKRKKVNKRRRLPNGFGQISEIKNRNLRNPFRAMVTVGKDPSGKPICKPLKPESYFPTYNDAYKALVEYNQNPYDLSPSITVKELYEKWSKEYFKTLQSPGSVKAVEYAWRFCSSIYTMRAIDVRSRHIKGCMEDGVITEDGKIKHPRAHVKNKIKVIFNKMFDYALEYELVEKNYARLFSLPDELRRETETVKNSHKAFSDEEMAYLWDNVANKQYVDLLLIQCYSGWRPQELCSLKVEDVDLENMTFKGGCKTEAGKNRIVPIHSKVQPFVMKYYNGAVRSGSTELFYCIIEGRRVSLNYPRYRSGLQRIFDELKFEPGHRPHDARKHFVTMAKKYGVDEYAIKYIVGHIISDITEKVYTQRELNWLRSEMEKIK